MRYLVVLLMLCGCATTEKVWNRPGASQQEFYMDRGQCQAQAFGAPGMYTMQVVMVFNACMQGRGWYLEEREIPTQTAPRWSPDAFKACHDEAERDAPTKNGMDPEYRMIYGRCIERRKN